MYVEAALPSLYKNNMRMRNCYSFANRNQLLRVASTSAFGGFAGAARLAAAAPAILVLAGALTTPGARFCRSFSFSAR